MMREMHRAVGLIGEVARNEGIDCGYAKGGAIWVRLRYRADAAAGRDVRRRGLSDAYRWLGPAETLGWNAYSAALSDWERSNTLDC